MADSLTGTYRGTPYVIGENRKSGTITVTDPDDHSTHKVALLRDPRSGQLQMTAIDGVTMSLINSMVSARQKAGLEQLARFIRSAEANITRAIAQADHIVAPAEAAAKASTKAERPEATRNAEVSRDHDGATKIGAKIPGQAKAPLPKARPKPSGPDQPSAATDSAPDPDTAIQNALNTANGTTTWPGPADKAAGGGANGPDQAAKKPPARTSDQSHPLDPVVVREPAHRGPVGLAKEAGIDDIATRQPGHGHARNARASHRGYHPPGPRHAHHAALKTQTGQELPPDYWFHVHRQDGMYQPPGQDQSGARSAPNAGPRGGKPPRL